MEPAASKSTNSSAGLEVFQKAPLSLAGPESSKAGKAKQKRFLKSRSAGLKSKLGSRSSQAASKVKESQVQDENSGPAGKLKKALSAKIRVQDKSALCQSKCKSTSSVAKRKLLGDQNINLIQPTSVTASDLKRVLGRSPTKQHETERSPVHSKLDKPVVSPSSIPPRYSAIPMKEISANLIKGLHCDEIFPNSTYLEATKAEIRKIMKQSNPERYAKLKASACGSMEDAVKLIKNLHEGIDDSNQQFAIHGQTFSPNVNPMALLFPPSPTAAVDPVGMNVEIDSSPYCIDSLQLDTASNCSSTPEYKPSDFIDLMDSTTEFTGPVAMETGGCWSMSPVERPKMFPHKLY